MLIDDVREQIIVEEYFDPRNGNQNGGYKYVHKKDLYNLIFSHNIAR
jgi:hypothetical protein